MNDRAKVITTLIGLSIAIIFLVIRDYQYHENQKESKITNYKIDSLQKIIAGKQSLNDIKSKYLKSDGWELIADKNGCKLYFKRMVVKEEGLASNSYYHAFWSICENGGTSIIIK